MLREVEQANEQWRQVQEQGQQQQGHDQGHDRWMKTEQERREGEFGLVGAVQLELEETPTRGPAQWMLHLKDRRAAVARSARMKMGKHASSFATDEKHSRQLLTLDRAIACMHGGVSKTRNRQQR
jgi:hypothetical protein